MAELPQPVLRQPGLGLVRSGRQVSMPARGVLGAERLYAHTCMAWHGKAHAAVTGPVNCRVSWHLHLHHASPAQYVVEGCTDTLTPPPSRPLLVKGSGAGATENLAHQLRFIWQLKPVTGCQGAHRQRHGSRPGGALAQLAVQRRWLSLHQRSSGLPWRGRVACSWTAWGQTA